MNPRQNFDELSPETRAALLYAFEREIQPYAIGRWSQKALQEHYGVSRGQFRWASDQLIVDGLVDFDGKPTAKALGLIPVETWNELRETLLEHIKYLDKTIENNRTLISQLNAEVTNLRDGVKNLTAGSEEITKTLDKYRPLVELSELLKPMGFGVHWIRSVVALTMVETATKQKLEKLGYKVEHKKFGELSEILETALREKENRRLKPRLIGGLQELRKARNYLEHEGHKFKDVSKEEADLIISRVRDLIHEIAE